MADYLFFRNPGNTGPKSDTALFEILGEIRARKRIPLFFEHPGKYRPDKGHRFFLKIQGKQGPPVVRLLFLITGEMQTA
jgi:hypothetical protein